MNLDEKARKQEIKDRLVIPESMVIRVDKEHAKYIELIRAIYSNDFANPRPSEIVQTILKWYIEKEDIQVEVGLAAEALEELLDEKNEGL